MKKVIRLDEFVSTRKDLGTLCNKIVISSYVIFMYRNAGHPVLDNESEEPGM
jgi:hypothetical protein